MGYRRGLIQQSGEIRTGEALKKKFRTLRDSKVPTGDRNCPEHIVEAKRAFRLVNERVMLNTTADMLGEYETTGAYEDRIYPGTDSPLSDDPAPKSTPRTGAPGGALMTPLRLKRKQQSSSDEISGTDVLALIKMESDHRRDENERRDEERLDAERARKDELQLRREEMRPELEMRLEEAAERRSEMMLFMFAWLNKNAE